MRAMKAKIIIFFACFVAVAACTDNAAPVPTLVPTAWLEATATPLPTTLPATYTPVVAPLVTDETADALQDVDWDTCQEAVTTQQELLELQAQGQDVAELATAVAELIVELDDCVILMTPTPFNE
jgi:hypothetical protein